MSRFRQVTHNLGGGDTYQAMHTDHSGEILRMRQKVGEVMAQYPDINDAPSEERKDTVILAAAAALLEVHDDTGISLDNWIGPLELVHEALWLIGEDRGTFLANGV